ncbi:MAG: hypothetical protein MZU97_07795 [Bacillus subtilis]|nr:hypothetical protein [Bacillus subtilis]
MSSFAAGWLTRPSYGPNDFINDSQCRCPLHGAFSIFLSCLFTAFGFSMEIEHRRGLIADSHLPRCIRPWGPSWRRRRWARSPPALLRRRGRLHGHPPGRSRRLRHAS